ncbi:MAG: hypothetical protein LUF04_08270 [Bacteroides sp.]|nr:hypothetical protein [Bacteroides sp.]
MMKYMFTGLLCLYALSAPTQEVCLYQRPVDYQLYPRDHTGYGQVEISGELLSGNDRTISIHVDRENKRIATYTVAIRKEKRRKRFRIAIPVKAEPAEYTFSYQLRDDLPEEPIATHVVAGDVYLIAGQSNSVASGNSVPETEISPFSVHWVLRARKRLICRRIRSGGYRIPRVARTANLSSTDIRPMYCTG